MHKTYFVLIAILLLSVSSLFGTTYLTYWVNGVSQNTMVQGDTIAWELDVAEAGNGVVIDFYLDLDASHTISEGDILLESFELIDGFSEDDGPADSSDTPDGLIYVFFGSFGIAPQNYLLQATDEDESTVLNWFSVSVMPNPTATISGRVYIEGTSAPDPLFENLMVGAFGSEGQLFSGLTDNSGIYTINLPGSEDPWEVGPFFSNFLPGYIPLSQEQEIYIPAGNIDSINFYYGLPQAWVYGSLRDQDGLLIERDGYIELENRDTDSDTEGIIQGGYFALPAAIQIEGQDSTNTFALYPNDEIVYPDYLPPYSGDEFELSFGDSIEKDLIVYETNANIYGFVTENDGSPSQAYHFWFGSVEFGSSEVYSDPVSGYFELFVREGAIYDIWLQDDPEYGTPPPPGYILEDGNGRFADSGDTVYFNFYDPTGLPGVNESTRIPNQVDLKQNYPNPFNPQTTIKFGLPDAAQVKITVYNLLGEQIAVLINAKKAAGYHQITWDAGMYASGMYLYVLKSGKILETRKLLLLK